MKVGDKFPTRDGLGQATVIYISKNVKPHPVQVELAYYFYGKDKPPGYMFMSFTGDGMYYTTGEEFKWDLMK